MTIDPLWVKVGAWVIVSLFGCLGLIHWWGFRKVVGELEDIKEGLGVVHVKLAATDAWQTAHDRQDDRWHTEDVERFRMLEMNIDKKRTST